MQAFDDVSVRHGAAAVRPIPALLDGMARSPGAPEYWWVYIALFSTLIPSVFNLMMGVWSLSRGLPFVSRAPARALPQGRAVTFHNRWLVAFVITAQWAFGAALPLAVLALLIEGVPRLFPDIGHSFLAWAHFVADPDLPNQVIKGVLNRPGSR